MVLTVLKLKFPPQLRRREQNWCLTTQWLTHHLRHVCGFMTIKLRLEKEQLVLMVREAFCWAWWFRVVDRLCKVSHALFSA